MTITNLKNSGMKLQVKVRTKTLKTMEPISQEEIEAAVKKFLCKDEKSAILLLRAMTFKTEVDDEIKKEFGFSVWPNEEQIISLRNEFRYQRSKLNSEFMEIPNCFDVVGLDPVLKSILYYHMSTKMKFVPDDEWNKAQYLLHSENIKYNFGGISLLRFNMNEAKKLLKYSKEIAKMFDIFLSTKNSETKISDYTVETEGVVDEKKEEKNNSEKEILEEIKEDDKNEEKNEPTEEIDNLLKNQESVKEFFEAIEHLNSVGIDLKLIPTLIDSKNELKKFIKSVEHLELIKLSPEKIIALKAVFK